MFSRMHKLAQLRFRDWHVLLRSLVLLPWTAWRLKRAGLQAILYSIKEKEPEKKPAAREDDLSRAKNIARLVHIAAHHGPYRANCLCRSLVLLRLLAWQGMTGVLKLGARLEDQQFDAHAWVQLHGEVVNDRDNIDGTFSQFGSL